MDKETSYLKDILAKINPVYLSQGENWKAAYQEFDNIPSVNDILARASLISSWMLQHVEQKTQKIEIRYLPPGAHGADDPLRQQAEVHVKIWF